MTDEYRGDLEAAHARIAQLEEQLREARNAKTPANAETEAHHDASVTTPKKGPSGFKIVPIAIVAATLPIAIVAVSRRDFDTALVVMAVAVALGFALVGRMVLQAEKETKLAAEASANKLAEARRRARLEQEKELRDLRGE